MEENTLINRSAEESGLKKRTWFVRVASAKGQALLFCSSDITVVF